ncbi:hypothetical protein NDU88_004625 [Pleurodeles waltl]|uniref:Uncharacterized protein n=1 Tax=Pleurodeles waltl TaxID=8319 RepID=A0AAV7SJG1_PLEWA|nr:hypothetical protein NDU88_004625 [Pleurodeles waltl]
MLRKHWHILVPGIPAPVPLLTGRAGRPRLLPEERLRVYQVSGNAGGPDSAVLAPSVTRVLSVDQDDEVSGSTNTWLLRVARYMYGLAPELRLSELAQGRQAERGRYFSHKRMIRVGVCH